MHNYLIIEVKLIKSIIKLASKYPNDKLITITNTLDSNILSFLNIPLKFIPEIANAATKEQII